MKTKRNIIFLSVILIPYFALAQNQLFTDYEVLLKASQFQKIIESYFLNVKEDGIFNEESNFQIEDFSVTTYIPSLQEDLETQIAGIEITFEQESNINLLDISQLEVMTLLKSIQVRIGSIHTEKQITRRVGGSFVNTTIKGHCSDVWLVLNQAEELSIQTSWDIETQNNEMYGVLYQLYLNKSPSFNIQNISCSGITGYAEIVSEKILEKLNSKKIIEEELGMLLREKMNFILDKINNKIKETSLVSDPHAELQVSKNIESIAYTQQGVLIQGQVKIEKKSARNHYPVKSVKFQRVEVPLRYDLRRDCDQVQDSWYDPDLWFFYEDWEVELAQEQDEMNFGQNIFKTFCDYQKEETNQINQEGEGAYIKFPFQLTQKLIQFLYENQALDKGIQSSKIEGLSRLMNSRWAQFFTFKDLMSFPKNTDFYFYFTPQKEPEVLQINKLSSNELGIELYAPLIQYMYAPQNQKYIPYVNMYWEVYQPLYIQTYEDKIKFNLFQPDLKMTYEFNKKYLSSYRVKSKKIKVDTFETSVSDSVQDMSWEIHLNEILPFDLDLDIKSLKMEQSEIKLEF